MKLIYALLFVLFVTPAAADPIYLIYSPGSTKEALPDPCDPNDSVPRVIRDLDGEVIGDHELSLFVYCTPEIIGEYDHETQTGEPKVMKRAKAIEAIVAAFIKGGTPPEHIFLGGKSAGAWANALVARRGKVTFNGTVAFAPAFAGQTRFRPQGWQVLHDELSAYIRETPVMDALVYVFKNDKYTDNEELAVTFDIPGVEFTKSRCAQHNGPYSYCFRRTEQDYILGFIANRVLP